MKQRILLSMLMLCIITSLFAQKNRKQSSNTTGFAITAVEKGGRNWKEVKMVDVVTGQELKSIYSSSADLQPLNARTGEPVKKQNDAAKNALTVISDQPGTAKKVVNLDQELLKEKVKADADQGNAIKEIQVYKVSPDNQRIMIRTNTNTQVYYRVGGPIQSDKPFATNSAAMAYDKKHDRLYYTPMGINQLRYIDLKTNKIYYFEDEAFGVVNGMGDVNHQITRMVIASDGNGYALTNDARNLLRFTTGKNPEITDLGEVTEAAGAEISIHSSRGYGGDMIADASGNLYLITANRNVFKINIESKNATRVGVISGLPQGFSTNGAMVEEGSKVIIASSESTVGYFRFDLNTLQAEKVSSSADVFNASDLANGNLAFEKNKKQRRNEETKPEEKPVVTDTKTKPVISDEMTVRGISIYPNPVTNGIVKLSFEDQPAGRYQVQVFDLSGKLVSSKEVNVQNKLQVAQLDLADVLSRGTYFVKIVNQEKNISSITKLVVQ
jgi:hypothetical protein